MTKVMLEWPQILGLYSKKKEKGQVNQLDVGNKNTNTTVVVTIQGQAKTARTKPDDQQLEQVIIITAH